MTATTSRLMPRLFSPSGALIAAVAMAVVLAILPARWTDRPRQAAMAALRPGQVAATATRQYATQTIERVRCHFDSASRLADAEEESRRLRIENERLLVELAAARGQTASAGDDDPAGRLLASSRVPARVLGRQARAFLARRNLLDAGAAAGVDPGDLVVDCPTLIDRGSDAGLQPGQLVLAGRRIWGKIALLGPNTCTVRAITEHGYRDLVRLRAADASPDAAAPPIEGMLEGTGERLARIRLVEVTAPVSLGDLVYAASMKGLTSAPLLYGRVTRLERPAGAAHWDIWMEPAVAGEPDRVAVLRTEVNPLRVAKANEGVAGEKAESEEDK
jgi:cell shape-determining protein MreC